MNKKNAVGLNDGGRESEPPSFGGAVCPIEGTVDAGAATGVYLFFRAQPGFFFRKKWGCIKKTPHPSFLR